MTTTTFRQEPGNWLIGTVDGLDVHAKVFSEPSGFGMPEDRRISKLWVAIHDGAPLYNYDRGLDFSHLNAEGLALIVAAVAGAIR